MRWWNRARFLVSHRFNSVQRDPTVRAGGKSPAVVVKHRPETDLPSGILRALPWDSLEHHERWRVVSVWHYVAIEKNELPAEQRNPIERDREARLDPNIRYGERERMAGAFNGGQH